MDSRRWGREGERGGRVGGPRETFPSASDISALNGVNASKAWYPGPKIREFYDDRTKKTRPLCQFVCEERKKETNSVIRTRLRPCFLKVHALYVKFRLYIYDHDQ